MGQSLTQIADGDERFHIFVAENAACDVIGFISGGKEREADVVNESELYAIYLLAEYQGQGIGAALTAQLVNQLVAQRYQMMRVWVLEGNPAQGFYERLGGRRSGEKPLSMGDQQFVELAYSWSNLAGLQQYLG